MLIAIRDGRKVNFRPIELTHRPPGVWLTGTAAEQGPAPKRPAERCRTTPPARSAAPRPRHRYPTSATSRGPLNAVVGRFTPTDVLVIVSESSEHGGRVQRRGCALRWRKSGPVVMTGPIRAIRERRRDPSWRQIGLSGSFSLHDGRSRQRHSLDIDWRVSVRSWLPASQPLP
jgi:hypothetical protein